MIRKFHTSFAKLTVRQLQLIHRLRERESDRVILWVQVYCTLRQAIIQCICKCNTHTLIHSDWERERQSDIVYKKCIVLLGRQLFNVFVNATHTHLLSKNKLIHLSLQTNQHIFSMPKKIEVKEWRKNLAFFKELLVLFD